MHRWDNCVNQSYAAFTFSSSSNRSTVSAGLAIQAVVEARRACTCTVSLSLLYNGDIIYLEVICPGRQELITNMQRLGRIDSTKVLLTNPNTPRFVANIDKYIVATLGDSVRKVPCSVHTTYR